MTVRQVSFRQNFLLLTLLAQSVGFAAGLLCGQLLSDSISIMVTHLLAAVLLAGLLQLPVSWTVLNALIPLILLSSLYIQVPPVILIAVFFMLFLIYAPSFIFRVPYYPTHISMYNEVARLLPKNTRLQFLDAGCGNAALLIHLARQFPEVQFTGIELSPLSYLNAWLRVRFSGLSNISLKFADFMALEFNKYDFVYAFLAPPIMPAFWEKAAKEMRTGSKLAINSFPLPVQEDSKVILPGERADRSGTLYIYTIKP